MAARSMHEIMEHVGDLAKLDIAEGQEKQLEDDLQEILRFVDKMKEFQLPEEAVWRDDAVVNGDRRSDMMANAPEANGQGFVVPKSF